MRDTVAPGFLCKITPAGRKVFMLQYRTKAGERCKPALGQYGELTVDQARTKVSDSRVTTPSILKACRRRSR
ncbi:Arm DNA-binding domain-containing protein [Xanthomonas theicola]|uniref:Arm DNA-binding domain-containing protein n=1 Tax=Xanthomonas theicola TaxID=56464 RepID=UPI003CCD624E